VSDDAERGRQLMAAAEAAIESIETYTCVIHCHERIKGKVRKPESILSRFRRPRSIYLRWQEGPYEGLQCSHDPDRDGADKFMARETGMKGLVGARAWRHDEPMIDAMYPHHFRVHETNVMFLLDLTARTQARAEELGKLTVEGIVDETDRFLRRPATRLDCRLSPDPGDGLRWLRTQFWFDHETRLPLHFKLYDFDGEMSGEYAFAELVPNASLPANAFDTPKL
jgi:hypothetical protein